MEKINVKKLFSIDKEDAIKDEFLSKKNIVYICKNLINGKVYIGETKDSLYNRWVGNNKLSHKGVYEYNKESNRILYRALRKYGLENFEVSVLEENFKTEEERKNSETKWIEKFNSFVGYDKCNGYNMNTGGNSCEHILTKETRKKALENNRKNHNGKLGFQTDEARKKARQTQFKKYGMLAMHLPENKEKAKKAQDIIREKNGGVLPFNTKEAIEKAQKSAPLHRMIGCINRHIEILKNKNLEINVQNYVLETDDQKHMWQQHIPHVLNRINELRQISKWNNDMENIFSNLIYDDTKKGLNKIIFK